MGTQSFEQWNADDIELKRGDVIGARDALVECMYRGQAETFERQKERLGLASDDDAVRQSVIGSIRLAMTAVGGSYDVPTKEHLIDAVDVLARKAKTWGTPEDVIKAHRSEMMKVLRKI